MQRRAQNLALLLASLLFIELVLRVFDPIGIAHFSEVRRYQQGLDFGAAWGYLHRPHWRARIQGVDVTINSHGLRGPETTIAKPAGTKRLLILGDSVVFGWGAPQDSIFPARLQRSLAARNPAVEVIAAGVASWNTRTQVEWLRARGVAFQPDVLLLVIVGNDADPIYVGRTDVPRDSLFASGAPRRALRSSLRDAWQRAYQHVRIFAYVQFARVFARQRGIEAQGYAEDSPQWRDARLALDDIIDLCGENGVELVVFLYGDDERVRRSGVLAAYRNHLATRGIPAHTLPSIIFEDRRYQNSIVDGHENAAGHAILARTVAPAVTPALPD